MTKTFTTLEILNICAWYKQLRDKDTKPLNILPLKVQWTLKKNISALTPISDNFIEFQTSAEEGLKSKYIGDDKSFDDTDENGNQVRKVKDEFLPEFQNEVNELNQKIQEILDETNEIELTPINVDAFIDNLDPESTALTVDDLEVLASMGEE